jgi:calcineurin-like phosphoesterase family protein
MKHAKENNALFIEALPKKTRKILCIGNHDNKSASWYMNNGWDFACRTFTIKLFNRKILFSHVPKAVRYPYSNIHGHTHGNNHRGELLPGGIEIALEKTNYKPLDLELLLVKNPLIEKEEDWSI